MCEESWILDEWSSIVSLLQDRRIYVQIKAYDRFCADGIYRVGYMHRGCMIPMKITVISSILHSYNENVHYKT